MKLFHTVPLAPLVLAEPRDLRTMTGRLFVHSDGRRSDPWLVMRYVNEDRGTEIISSHPTEQEAERAVRRLMFPPLLQEGEIE